jgi:hypothetical protein
MSWRAVNEFLLTTATHYQAWLAAKYMSDQNTQKPRNTQNVKQPAARQEQQRQAAVPPAATHPSRQSPPIGAQNGNAAIAPNPYANEEFFN